MPMFGKKNKNKNEKPEGVASQDDDNVDDSSLENADDEDNNDLNDLLGDPDEDGSSNGDSAEDDEGGSALAGLGLGDEDDEEMDSDLMDIFSSEADEIDVDLVALLAGLEPVDASSILIQAQSIVASLRRMLYG